MNAPNLGYSEPEFCEARVNLQGFTIERLYLLPAMSGSHWFKGRLLLQSALLFLDAVHSKLRFASRTHSAMFLIRLPS